MRELITFFILMTFWLVWSGLYDFFHLTLGVVSCLIVTLWSRDFLIGDTKVSILDRSVQFLKFSMYCVWLVYQIVLANIQVMKIAFTPDVLSVIDPQIVKFDSKMNSDLAKYNLAHSITLTPGTVTVQIEDGVFIVHALTEDAAKGVPGEMISRVLRIFGGKG